MSILSNNKIDENIEYLYDDIKKVIIDIAINVENNYLLRVLMYN